MPRKPYAKDAVHVRAFMQMNVHDRGWQDACAVDNHLYLKYSPKIGRRLERIYQAYPQPSERMQRRIDRIKVAAQWEVALLAEERDRRRQPLLERYSRLKGRQALRSLKRLDARCPYWRSVLLWYPLVYLPFVSLPRFLGRQKRFWDTVGALFLAMLIAAGIVLAALCVKGLVTAVPEAYQNWQLERQYEREDREARERWEAEQAERARRQAEERARWERENPEEAAYWRAVEAQERAREAALREQRLADAAAWEENEKARRAEERAQFWRDVGAWATNELPGLMLWALIAVFVWGAYLAAGAIIAWQLLRLLGHGILRVAEFAWQFVPEPSPDRTPVFDPLWSALRRLRSGLAAFGKAVSEWWQLISDVWHDFHQRICGSVEIEGVTD